MIAIAFFVGLRLIFGWGVGAAPLFTLLAMLVLICLTAALSIGRNSERMGA